MENETQSADFKERSQEALAKITKILEEHQVTFLPRIDYQEQGEHKIVVALFDAKPLPKEEPKEKKDD